MNLSMKKVLRFILLTIYVLILIVITSRFVGFSASKHVLLFAAPFLPFFPILGLIWLKPKEEKYGWVLFTIWLGSTYVSLGTTPEWIVFSVITALAISGYFISPWLFVLAWFAHIVWDFMPRELPELLLQLPQSCMIFDGLIGFYIAWRIVKKL